MRGLLRVSPGTVLAHFAHGKKATKVEVRIKIEKAPPAQSPYFWTIQFATVGKDPANKGKAVNKGYFGLQSGGMLNEQAVGKMLVFSAAGSTEAKAGNGSVIESPILALEREVISVIRRPFDWQEGVS